MAAKPRIILSRDGAADPPFLPSIAGRSSRLYRTIPSMTSATRTHLDQLENQSIFIFREAYHAFKKIAMPLSMGKDSNVLIWLARKSFFCSEGKITARERAVRDFTRIDAPYEAPEGAEIVGRTDRQSVDESVATIL